MTRKKVLVVSETIFSDRLLDTMRFADMDGADTETYCLKRLNAFEETYMSLVAKSTVPNLRWKIVRFWRQLARYVAPIGCDTTSLDDHYRVDCVAWSRRKRFLMFFMSRLLKRSSMMRRLMLGLVTRVMPMPEDLMAHEFSQFDAVFVFSLGNLRSAAIPPITKYFKAQGKPVIAYIQSWDNPTTKGYRSIQPDTVLCWTELMRDEVATYMNIKRERTLAVGVPLFEKVEHQARHESRHILLATKSPKSYQHNPDLAALIGAFARSLGLRFTVRIHPLSLDTSFAHELDKMKSYAVKFGFSIVCPSQDGDGAILCREYDRKAAEVFNGVDIFVSIFSTMNLEAVNAGKATINIDFELGETQSDTGRHDIAIDRRQIHNQRVLSYGSIHNVQSVGALYQAILACCGDGGAMDAQSRTQLVETECRPIYDHLKVNQVVADILKR